MSIPDFLSIGHACHDTAPSGFLPGGAVTYSGLFAKNLKLNTAILSSFGEDYLFRNLFDGIQLKVVSADQTTIFQNEYTEGLRQQHLLARANDIRTSDLPEEWEKSKMVLIGPIANEVDFKFLDIFEEAIICVNPQGWMRRWDAKGKVFNNKFDHYEKLVKADMTIISEDDVQKDYKVIKELAAILEVLIVTKGDRGCDVYFKNKRTSFSAFPAKMKDATGAGDTFSTAFLVNYFETQDLFKSAKYANIAASFCIEALGISGLPNRQLIEERYKHFYKE